MTYVPVPRMHCENDQIAPQHYRSALGHFVKNGRPISYRPLHQMPTKRNDRSHWEQIIYEPLGAKFEKKSLASFRALPSL